MPLAKVLVEPVHDLDESVKLSFKVDKTWPELPTYETGQRLPTLQALGDALIDDVGYLAGQGWPLRSLAAIVWAQSSTPSHLGLRLARDPDVRVRRSFAGQLAQTEPVEAQREVREILANDSCYSVRVRLAAPEG
ncbi:MAG: hypothetical protein ACJ74O_05245 [Frankiaceae bacterium]